MNHSDHPIFFDHSGTRWRRIVRFATAVALAVSVAGAIFSFSILALPLSPLTLSEKSYVHRFIPKIETREEAARKFLAHKASAKLKNVIAKENATKPKVRHRSPGAPNSTVIGFYANWLPGSFDSFKDHASSLTYVMPQWLKLTPDGNKPGADGKLFASRYDPTTSDPDLEKQAAKSGVGIIPMLDNNDDKAHGFDWKRYRNLLRDKQAQHDLAIQLRDFLKSKRYAGINIDFELPAGMTPADEAEAGKLLHDALPEFLKTLRSVFRPAHLLVTQDLPASDPKLDYEKLNDVNDFVIVMLYDYHWITGEPGAIAPQWWIEQVAEQLFSKMDGEKVVLGIGNYCYDWPITYDKNGDMKAKGPAEKLLLGTALKLAQDAGAKIETDQSDLNPHFYYADQNGVDHVVYILDATTAYNTVMALKGYGPRGAALWLLGQEDPSIWSFFGEGKLGKPVRKSGLERVLCDVANKGDGEIMEVVGRPKAGFRKLTFDSDGLVCSQAFEQYPGQFLVQRSGYDPSAKRIALTFDDGPDRTWTPRILDVLRRNGVKATFFVIGKNAENNTHILRECWADGNEIGNHTYTHPWLSKSSALRAELEVNATERIIESVTGHSTRLFRPPFGDGADSNAQTAREAELLLRMQRLGYVTVGMNIDPEDYTRPGVDKIARSAIGKVKDPNTKGSVILLHDGGGDRSQTVAALPGIISGLKSKRYKFVTVSDLVPNTSYASLFPRATRRELAIDGLDQVFFESGFALTRGLQIVFLVAILLGVLRILIVAPLAIIQTRRARHAADTSGFRPPVTVIIPAYNESNVISRTMQTVLDSDYPDMRVIVVDDGSTDGTAEVVGREYGSHPRVTLVRKENGGKATALNVGIEQADTEVIVCLDADTVFDRNTIARLARHFEDPKIGAVAGNVKVGNRMNALTIWQSLEYITSQNFDRRAYAALDSVPIVPGAVGAWRKSAILKAGGYHSNTLAEDTDLTFRIRILGYHVRAENEAYAYTEAPQSVGSLAKQRFRWSFGILQSLWKHRNLLFRPRYGAFSMLVMPGMWVYNILFQALSPVVDIAVLLSLYNGDYVSVLSYYAAFFVLDFIAALIAFRLDREDMKQLTWLFWQRFFYRQFMYYVIIRSIVAALHGGTVGWGKLQRKATAALPQ